MRDGSMTSGSFTRSISPSAQYFSALCSPLVWRRRTRCPICGVQVRKSHSKPRNATIRAQMRMRSRVILCTLVDTRPRTARTAVSPSNEPAAGWVICHRPARAPSALDAATCASAFGTSCAVAAARDRGRCTVMDHARRRRLFKRLARSRARLKGVLWSWAERGSILVGFAWLLLRTRTDGTPALPTDLPSLEKRSRSRRRRRYDPSVR